jgi:hypothetical protein
MQEETLKKLYQARKNLEDIAGELGFDILSIIGNKRVSLNDNFPALIEEKSINFNTADLIRLFKAFFIFQSLTLEALDYIIINSLGKNIINDMEVKKRNLENELWNEYFNKLMGD